MKCSIDSDVLREAMSLIEGYQELRAKCRKLKIPI